MLLLRRAGLLILLLAMAFLAVNALPGDAALATMDRTAAPAEVAARRVQLGLDQPVLVRLGHWLGGLATGDLGMSARGTPVWSIVGQNFPNTLLLGGLALACTVLLSLGLGATSVLRPGRWLDRVVSAGSMVLLAVPEFVAAYALVVVFALGLGLLPAVAVVSADGTPDPAMLVLPVLALALPQVGWNTRIVRSAFTEQIRAPHVDSAILDGLPRHRILTHYLLPGAAPTIAAGLATSVGMLLGGTVVVETLFNFPGMGAVLADAIRSRDAPLVAGVVALTGCTITVLLMLADLVRAWAVRR